MTSEEVVTGEKIQALADVYLGNVSDFNFNPWIAQQTAKHQVLEQLPEYYLNPHIVFCYSHCLDTLADKIHQFQNPFVLITHNSDNNIDWTPSVRTILMCHQLQSWFAQNVAIRYNKLVPLPIGMANRQWPHGDIDFFRDFVPPMEKPYHIYFYFNMNTNPCRRMECMRQLQDKIPTSPPLNPHDYKLLLSQYQFCICPEGNGYDTHRFWEALYLKVIPIVVNSPFIQELRQTYRIPMVVLDSWSDLEPTSLHYTDQWFECDDVLFSSIEKRIKDI